MSNVSISLDQLLTSGLRQAAERAGHGAAVEAGLGKLIDIAVKTAGVPSSPMSAGEIAGRLGVTQDHVDVFGALVGLARHGGLLK